MNVTTYVDESSLVNRSKISLTRISRLPIPTIKNSLYLLDNYARVVELVDTRDLKSLAEKRAGSSPAPGTIYLRI